MEAKLNLEMSLMDSSLVYGIWEATPEEPRTELK
jgi:hypothetical protein